MVLKKSYPSSCVLCNCIIWLECRSRLCYPHFLLHFFVPPTPFFVDENSIWHKIRIPAKLGTLHLSLSLDLPDLLFCHVTKLGESDEKCSLQIIHSDAFKVFVNLLCNDFF